MASLGPFIRVAYLLTWILLAPWFYLYTRVLDGAFPWWMWLLTPFAFIGGWGPTAAALVVTGRREGRPGVRRLLERITRWRVSPGWYLVTLLLPTLATAASLLIVEGGATTLRQFDAPALLAKLPMIYAMALPFGPLGEELGWRGFALPRLLPRFGPWGATLIIGIIWTFWHVPMMLFMPGASMPAFMDLSSGSIAIYLVQLTAESALMTLLFLRTKGSVLIAVLAHLAFNTAESVLFAGLPQRPDPQLREIYLVNVGVLALLGLAGLYRVGRWPVRARGLEASTPL